MKIDQELKFYMILWLYAIIVVIATMLIIFAPNDLGVLAKLFWVFMLFGLCWGAEDIVGFFVSKYETREG